MKKSEIEALKDAFNIPEPERKNIFLPSFREKLKKNNVKPLFPIIFRYASMAALAAVVIGVWSTSDHTESFRYEYNRDFVISGTASEPVSTVTTAVTTASTAAATTQTSGSQNTTVPPQTTPVTVNTVSATSTAVSTQSIVSQTTVTTSVTAAVTTEPEATDPPQSVYKDLTVTPAVTYEKTDDAIDLRDVNDNMNSGSDPPLDGIGNPSGELPEAVVKMAENSEYIVYASVDEIFYTDVDGAPYTQENLTVHSAHKGELELMDRISLYVPGGYMPADKYIEYTGIELTLPENSVIYDYGGNNGIQQVGATYIFFIENGSSSMPEGAFQLTEETDISVFEYKNGMYISLGDGALSFTEDMFKGLCESL